MISKRMMFLSLALTSFSQFCFSYQVESAANIDAAVRNFVLKTAVRDSDEDRVDVEIKKIKSLARLPACTSDIIASVPNNTSQTNMTAIALTCNGTYSWNVVIPVNVQIYSKVLVVKHNMAAHDMLAENDLEYASYNKSILYSGFFKNKEDVKGSQVTRFMTAGTVLNDRNIQKPILVIRNQITDIIVKKNSMVITMKGISKTDGKLNEVIKIYNPSSKRIIDAVVVGSNKAEAV